MRLIIEIIDGDVDAIFEHIDEDAHLYCANEDIYKTLRTDAKLFKLTEKFFKEVSA